MADIQIKRGTKKMILEYLIALPIVLVFFYLHEIGHALEHFRQTGKPGRIQIDFCGFRMVHFQTGDIKDRKKYCLAGGIFAGTIAFILGLVLTGIYRPVGYGLSMAGLMNLLYAPYEWHFCDRYIHPRVHRTGRYIIYFIGFIIATTLYLR